MIAASGVRFDGLDLLYVIYGVLFIATMIWLLKRVAAQNSNDFDLIKAREAAKLGLTGQMLPMSYNGIDLAPTKYIVLDNEPMLYEPKYIVPDETQIAIYEMFGAPAHGETAPFEYRMPVYNWRDHPIVFDWMLDEPACR